ncbi:hypothetical protein GCM10010124_02160 [Pilimelia terevasa]|uniref:Minor capsid protein n=1 Tax=Pilimelia terevasa TaxID=53372 RepID=A0A8J3BJF1_9ACTN|nr:hypothetical protein [Pilimelia terevasa]GGK13171.1 hypothetical protein GCM10010124_02160 [Pilimelia terevasa]
MSTSARQQEADRASIAFHLALTRIGAKTIADALRLWTNVPPTRTAAVSATWLRQAIHLVMTRRARARDLAMAYYRLARALRTGRTVADPRRPEPRYVTLDMLRREFNALSGKPAAPEPNDNEDQDQDQDQEEDEGGRDDANTAIEIEEGGEDAEADRILVEEIAALDRRERERERAAEAEAKTALEQLGTGNLDRKLGKTDTSASGDDVDAARDQAHRKAGTRQAATAERIVLDGGRGQLWTLTETDRRVIGYARVSRSGTPCGWCAMLISRGAVYRSRRSATHADGDRYHDNCHCYAEPLYSRQQMGSDLFDLNRQYAADWPRVTRGLSGARALSAWRRHIRQQQRRAQEARRTSVQEA